MEICYHIEVTKQCLCHDCPIGICEERKKEQGSNEAITTSNEAITTVIQ